MIKAKSVSVDDNYLRVEIEDGRVILTPWHHFRGLREATPEKRKSFELIGLNTILEWEELDVHLGVEEMFFVAKEEALLK